MKSKEVNQKVNRRMSVKQSLNRLFMILVAFIAAMTFTACVENDENGTGDEKPGQISGLGSNKGKVEGKAFELPEGVIFDGDLWGSDWNALLPNQQIHSATVKSAQVSSFYASITDGVTTRSIFNYRYDCRGSGLNVIIIIPLKNNTSRPIDVEFPAGMLFEAVDKKYQHGVLLKKTKVSVPAGGNTYRFALFLYCCNEHVTIPDTSTKYLKPVITNSKLLLHLCDLVKNKRINIEENMDTIEHWSEYVTMATNLQELVWKLTDRGQMLDKTDLDYIAGLPNSNQ